MKNILSVQNLTMSFGVNPLYEAVNFGVSAGERIAVVGPNGCGKSTLFKLLAGKLTPDEGELTYRGEITVGYLAQKQPFDPEDTPRRIVARAMKPVRDAIEEHDQVSTLLSDEPGDELDELLERQSQLQERIRKMGGWSWEHRVEEMLDRLGIHDWIDVPISRLSGGQRRRVDLARVLLQSPDLLLLDEPTNHLDTAVAEWLEHWLIDRAQTVLFVTHDRYFLERVATRILEVTNDDFYDYPGDYQTFMQRKLHREQIQKRTEHRRQKELQKELEALRGGVKSQNKHGKKRLDEIERLQNESTDIDDRRVEMKLAEPGEFSDVILNARGLYKSYGDNQLLEHAHFDVRPGDKIGVIGPNGCGKSTFLDMLAGRLRYDAGTIEKGKKTDIAYLGQHSPNVDPDDTVYDAFSESDYVWIGDSRFHKQSYLQRFLFDRRLQKSKMKSLSGGQKRRFALAEVFAEDPNLLLMDEPTNDLDLMSLEALETALEQFEGCLITVSHDRYFLNRICNVIVAFEDNMLQRYEGDYDAYRARKEEQLLQERASTAKPAPPAKEPDEPDEPTTPARKVTSPEVGLSWKEKRRLERLESEIETMEAQRRDIESTLSDPAFYDNEPERIEPLNRRLNQLQRQIEKLFEEWSALEERRG